METVEQCEKAVIEKKGDAQGKGGWETNCENERERV